MSSNDVIRYDLIVQEAMLGVVKKVLKDTQENGLKSDHHFYLTYATNFDGVEIPSSLLEKYPDEITIVLQHEFEDLQVHDTYFQVTLWFNNVPAHLKVPYLAIRAFFDPSVKFGLQFNAITEDDKKSSSEAQVAEVADIATVNKITKEKAIVDKSDADSNEGATDGSNIISLDSFRKK